MGQLYDNFIFNVKETKRKIAQSLPETFATRAAFNTLAT